MPLQPALAQQTLWLSGVAKTWQQQIDQCLLFMLSILGGVRLVVLECLSNNRY
jgi:hypothetical protein